MLVYDRDKSLLIIISWQSVFTPKKARQSQYNVKPDCFFFILWGCEPRIFTSRSKSSPRLIQKHFVMVMRKNSKKQ